MRSSFHFALVATFVLAGCNKLTSAKPRVAGDASAYTFSYNEVSSELYPGAEFVMTFAQRAPNARGMALNAVSTDAIDVLFDFGNGTVVKCENPAVTALTLRCVIPGNMPDGSPQLRLVMNNRTLALKKEGALKEIKVRMDRRLAALPRLTVPAASAAFTISAVAKVGNGTIGPGDTVLITGKGFSAGGPVQFHFSRNFGGLDRLCQPQVLSDTSARCSVPTGTSGSIKFWGEALHNPQVQARYAGALNVTP